jgi:hypothetical protein
MTRVQVTACIVICALLLVLGIIVGVTVSRHARSKHSARGGGDQWDPALLRALLSEAAIRTRGGAGSDEETGLASWRSMMPVSAAAAEETDMSLAAAEETDVEINPAAASSTGSGGFGGSTGRGNTRQRESEDDQRRAGLRTGHQLGYEGRAPRFNRADSNDRTLSWSSEEEDSAQLDSAEAEAEAVEINPTAVSGPGSGGSGGSTGRGTTRQRESADDQRIPKRHRDHAGDSPVKSLCDNLRITRWRSNDAGVLIPEYKAIFGGLASLDDPEYLKPFIDISARFLFHGYNTKRDYSFEEAGAIFRNRMCLCIVLDLVLVAPSGRGVAIECVMRSGICGLRTLYKEHMIEQFLPYNETLDEIGWPRHCLGLLPGADTNNAVCAVDLFRPVGSNSGADESDARFDAWIEWAPDMVYTNIMRHENVDLSPELQTGRPINDNNFATYNRKLGRPTVKRLFKTNKYAKSEVGEEAANFAELCALNNLKEWLSKLHDGRDTITRYLEYAVRPYQLENFTFDTDTDTDDPSNFLSTLQRMYVTSSREAQVGDERQRKAKAAARVNMRIERFKVQKDADDLAPIYLDLNRTVDRDAKSIFERDSIDLDMPGTTDKVIPADKIPEALAALGHEHREVEAIGSQNLRNFMKLVHFFRPPVVLRERNFRVHFNNAQMPYELASDTVLRFEPEKPGEYNGSVFITLEDDEGLSYDATQIFEIQIGHPDEDKEVKCNGPVPVREKRCVGHRDVVTLEDIHENDAYCYKNQCWNKSSIMQTFGNADLERDPITGVAINNFHKGWITTLTGLKVVVMEPEHQIDANNLLQGTGRIVYEDIKKKQLELIGKFVDSHLDGEGTISHDGRVYDVRMDKGYLKDLVPVQLPE